MPTLDKVLEKEQIRHERFKYYWNDEVKQAFDDLAVQYDNINNFASFGTWNHINKHFTDSIELNDSAQILDVCAGTNKVGLALLSRNPKVNVTAIDRSEGMQEIGMIKAKKKGLAIKSVISDVHKLPFDDNSFNIVTTSFASRHLRLDQVFQEIYRILKPGEYYYHHDLLKPRGRIFSIAYYLYLRFMLPLTAFIFLRKRGFFKAASAAFSSVDYFVKAINLFYTEDELTLLLGKVGFKNIETSVHAGGIAVVHKAQK